MRERSIQTPFLRKQPEVEMQQGVTVRIAGAFIVVCFTMLALPGCANVRAYEREKLADPIMERRDQFAKQTLEQKFFSTREGSIGGAIGIGGGCGCAK
jgi:hypothetical protein